MSHSWHGTQPTIVRTPIKKPADVRATNQSQSERGAYDERGGDRLKKGLLWVTGLTGIAIAATIVVDIVAGRGLF